MADLSKMIEALKKNPKKIVFTEGADERILKATERLGEDSFLQPVLVGKKEKIIEAAKERGYRIEKALIVDPDNYERMDEMIDMD